MNSPEEKEGKTLQPADETQEDCISAENQAGPNGTWPGEGSSCSKVGGSQDYQAGFDLVEEESDSEGDTDMDRDTESSQLSAGSHEVSSLRKKEAKSGSKSVQTSKRQTRNRRRGSRAKGKVNIEEMIRRQETASQIHNENERFRRKELRGALLGLRNQLSRPTKRPAVKLVLEAAIQELEELMSKEREDAELVESLKDKEKRLTFELENKLKEYEQHKQDAPSPATPMMPNSPAFPVPQISAGGWFPVFRPSPTQPSSMAQQVRSPVPPALFNPWSLARLPPTQQAPNPTLNLRPMVPPNMSHSLSQTAAGAQRPSLQPGPVIPALSQTAAGAQRPSLQPGPVIPALSQTAAGAQRPSLQPGPVIPALSQTAAGAQRPSLQPGPVIPALSQTAAGAQRPSLQPGPVIPALYPFQTAVIAPPPVTLHSPFTTPTSFPAVQRFATRSPPVTRTKDHQQLLTFLPQRPQLFLLPSQHNTPGVISRTAPLEQVRLNVATSSHMSKEDGDEYENTDQEDEKDARPGSKNGGESAETHCRPSTMVHYTTSADSEIMSAKETSAITDPTGQLVPEREDSTHQTTILKYPISSFNDILSPNPSASRKRPFHASREVPPLLKVDGDFLSHDFKNSNAGALSTQAKKFKSSHSSELISIELCDNPSYRLIPKNQLGSTKLKIGYFRKRRRKGCSADVDSSTSEEDNAQCPPHVHTPLQTTGHFMNTILCPGK